MLIASECSEKPCNAWHGMGSGGICLSFNQSSFRRARRTEDLNGCSLYPLATDLCALRRLVRFGIPYSFSLLRQPSLYTGDGVFSRSSRGSCCVGLLSVGIRQVAISQCSDAFQPDSMSSWRGVGRALARLLSFAARAIYLLSSQY